MIADFGLRIADFYNFSIHNPQSKIQNYIAGKGATG